MKQSQHPIAALDELRESLREAARRDIDSRRRLARRRRRRSAAIGLAALLGAATVAGAANLIAVGEPAPDVERPANLRPVTGRELVLTARDASGSGRWGVAIYQAPNGDACALAGEVRGVALGIAKAGRFQPFERGTSGACGRLDQSPYAVSDYRRLSGPPARTLVYGRVGVSMRRVVASSDTQRFSAPKGPGGAFLFVFDGFLGPEDIRLTWSAD